MRIITCNVNGIRSAVKKGFFDWMVVQEADFICLQELKAQEIDLSEVYLKPQGYHGYFHFASKKGYSGVAIYTRQTNPALIRKGLGFDIADTEGRFITLEYNSLAISSLYMPSGTSGEERQTIKFQFLDQYGAYLNSLYQANKPHIICGDWNIAHKTIDLKNWRGNQKNSGFLPEERLWMDKLLTKGGFHDAFRLVNQAPDQYTWWSNRGSAYEKNVGWRIDYQVISHHLVPTVKSAFIYKEKRFSDHAPLIMEYDILI